MEPGVKNGRVTRRDGQPLRTKIVATLGRANPSSYKRGFADQDDRTLAAHELTTGMLVERFLENGADVLRINLAHLKREDIKDFYKEVKDTVLAWEDPGEGDVPSVPRIAVLADLPGPKIRFNFEPAVTFEAGASFTVRFEPHATDNAGLVFVDDKPLKEAMDAFDAALPAVQCGELAGLHPFLDGAEEREPERGSLEHLSACRRLAENVLGIRCFEPRQARATFGSMMRSVQERLAAREAVLVRIGDGDIVLQVDGPSFRVGSPILPCVVLNAGQGPTEGKKAFTLKGVALEIPSCTTEDKEKLDKLLEAEFEDYDKPGWQPLLAFVGLSFTQTADDVLRLKRHIAATTSRLTDKAPRDYGTPAVIAKIESFKGWENRRFILDVADGLMVARGDLGLQLDIEEVPAMQKRLVQMCNKRGKPVITATEMLKSMTGNLEPTRAEGSDVFNAILDGSDAVMMSEETSSGRYALRAIRKMVRIAAEAECYFELEGLPKTKQSSGHRQRFEAFFLDADDLQRQHDSRFTAIIDTLTRPWAGALAHFCNRIRPELEWRFRLYQTKQAKSAMQTTTDRITQATCTLGEQGDVKGILAATTSGRTVRMLARLHPRTVIIGAAHDVLNTRKLTASWGVWPICIGTVQPAEGVDVMYDKCLKAIGSDAALHELLEGGDMIFTAGTPIETPGTTNLIQIRRYQRHQPAVAPAGPPQPEAPLI